MYSLRHLLKQEPVAVAAAVKLSLALAVIVNWIAWDEGAAMAAVVALEAWLNLFYVRNNSVSLGSLETLQKAADSGKKRAPRK